MTDGTKYVIGRKLGQGGMAETFEATRTHANGHGFRVALKQVLPELLGRSKDKEKEFLQRFSQEAQIGAKLDHPNIVRVVDTGILGGRPYLAMELVDGVSLSKLLNVCRRQERLLPSFVVMHIGVRCGGGARVRASTRGPSSGCDARQRASQQDGRVQTERFRDRAGLERRLGPHANTRLHG